MGEIPSRNVWFYTCTYFAVPKKIHESLNLLWLIASYRGNIASFSCLSVHAAVVRGL